MDLLYLEHLKSMKIQEGKLDAMKKVREEFTAIRSRGERATWDLWEGVIAQLEAEVMKEAMNAVHVAMVNEQTKDETIH